MNLKILLVTLVCVMSDEIKCNIVLVEFKLCLSCDECECWYLEYSTTV
jgi:hypothetical protein